tara:strand:+ start:126 stop:386 length:261 start_codon:yes stop_codon:yes gene_type:complete
MKKVYLSPFRESKKQLRKTYIVTIEKRGNDLILPIPREIVKAFGIQVGDVAIFEMLDNKCFIISFVKKTMFSFVEPYRFKKNKKRM